MELENRTPFVVRALRVDRGDNDVQCTLVVKSTFEQRNGRWVPAAEQMPLVAEKLDTAYGTFHCESFLHKEGVDVCVLGSVRLEQPAREARLRLQLGSERRELVVFGDRRWLRQGTELVASAPASFSELPLGYAHAYGGTTEHDYESVTYPDNPVGRGYYLSAERAEGQPLPNIESADAPATRSWSSELPVSGWGPYPCFWGIRAREGLVVRESEPNQLPLPRALPRLNNNAHSALVFPALPLDTPIVISGMRSHELSFQLPRVGLLAEFTIGDRVSHGEAALDGVALWVDAERITLTHRLHQRYEYRKAERRRVLLTEVTPNHGE